MIINLRFFDKMRTIMASCSFEPKDYKPEELEILAENAIIIYSKYCNHDFQRGVIEYFAQNSSQYPNFDITKLQNSIAVCQKFKVAEGGALEKSRHKLSKKHAPEAVELISDIIEYYYAWCSDSVNINDMLRLTTVFELLLEMTGSREGISAILDPIPNMKSWVNLVEGLLNLGWGGLERIEKFGKLDQAEKEILRKLLTCAKADDSKSVINNMISLANLDEERKEFFKFLKSENLADVIKDYQPNSGGNEIIQYAFDKILAILTMDHHAVKEQASRLGIFAPEKLESLATYVEKYKMPRDIFEQLLKDLASPHTKESTEYIPKDCDTNSIFSNIKQFGLSQKVGQKKPQASFLSPGDPAALFIGKMTKSCQFYTGDSSDAAVMPFYKDPTTRVIAIQTGKKIGAAAFVWLSRDNEGKMGMVLDSIEHLPEMKKIIPEFLQILSTKLCETDMDLYVGQGGGTPSLAYKTEHSQEESVPTLCRNNNIHPISEDYKPYGDSYNLYKIAPTYTLSLSKSKDLRRFEEGYELWKTNMINNAHEINTPSEVIETLLAKLPENLLDSISKGFREDSTEFLRLVLKLQEEYFTKMFIVLSSDFILRTTFDYYMSQIFKPNNSDIVSVFPQEEYKEESKHTFNSDENLLGNLCTIIELFSKRALEIEQDPELQNISSVSPTRMLGFISSDLSIGSICKLMKLRFINPTVEVTNITTTHYLNKVDSELLNSTLSKIKYEDIIDNHSPCPIPACGPQQQMQIFVNVIKKYEDEIIANPDILQNAHITSLTTFSLMNSGLSLESILKINKLVWVYKPHDNDLVNPGRPEFKIAQEDAEYIDQILAKIEVKNSHKSLWINENELPYFFNVLRKYEDEIIANPSLMEYRDIYYSIDQNLSHAQERDEPNQYGNIQDSISGYDTPALGLVDSNATDNNSLEIHPLDTQSGT